MVIAPSNVAGIRRCRGFDIYVSPQNGTVAWALIYVPQGIDWHGVGIRDTDPDAPASMYQPEQHVIASGLAGQEETLHTFARGSRSLADGDSVIFVVRSEVEVDPAALVQFRISFKIAFS
jgi:hypothetical protein